MAALQGEVWYCDQPLDQLAVLARSTEQGCQLRALADAIVVSLDRRRLAFADHHLYLLARAKAAEMVPRRQVDEVTRANGER